MPLLLGLNSGTSADGVDAGVFAFEGDGPALPIEVRACIHHDYPGAVRGLIEELITEGSGSLESLCHLNVAVGESFAEAAAIALEQARVRGPDVDVCGMHGQTIWHLPPQAAQAQGLRPSTWQIGEPAAMALQIGCPVASNFRAADMAAGGQGAPLTAILDHLLFTDPVKGRLRLNIGGIANVTWLPPGAAPEDVVAFDTGPGNTIIDQAVRALTGDQETCDRGGARALHGAVSEALLAELMEDPYFRMPPPKTTGRELFSAAWTRRAMDQAQAIGVEGDDLIATLTALTPASIADARERHLPPGSRVDELIVHGGGAHNPAIMKGLRDRLSVEVATVEDFGIPLQALEPLLFATLGWRCLRREATWHPRATGASRPTVLGELSWPAG